MTDLLYLTDAYLREVDATVVDVRTEPAPAVALDRTVFYPTGGGQPHDTGTLAGAGGDRRPQGGRRWSGTPWPAPATAAAGGRRRGPRRVDWDRRHALMRTHTALHVLCGVIWNEWGTPVTGGNMEPLAARMDFEFDPLPEGFGARVEELVNAELAAARPIEVSFLPRDTAVADARPDPHQGQHDPRDGRARSGSSTSSAWTSRPTAAPMSAPPTRSGASG